MMRCAIALMQTTASPIHFLRTSINSFSGVHYLRDKMPNAEPTRIERRCGLRFSQYQVPVFLKTLDGKLGTGFTLDLSCRGALLWTDLALTVGQFVEITLVMPSEITLGEDMSVRCQAHVLRLETGSTRAKPATAVKIEHYDFVPREFTPLQQRLSGGVHLSRA
jgi:hypothetical protein